MDAPSLPASLVLHDGELPDVCALLERLSLFYRERRDGATQEDLEHRWDVVIATPRRMLEFRPEAPGSDPVRIAVLERDSKTLRAMLRRAGIDLAIRRPVHPAALRLLILHSLYRGPERRTSPRVSVGAPVRFRAGLRHRDGVLAELSVCGCRLLSRVALEPGRRLTLQLPTEITGTRGFQVEGSVLRILPSEVLGLRSIVVTFGRRSQRAGARLEKVVNRHLAGPAVWSGSEPGLDDSRHGSSFPPDGSPAPVAPTEGAGLGAEERRTSPRREYVQHVIALGAEAGRVLMGRDISMGGMRVDPHPDLHVGDRLRVGLHLRARQKPLVVTAEVAREDGQEGFGLAFRELSDAARRDLQSLVDFLPILAARENGVDSGVIPAEILAHREAASG